MQSQPVLCPLLLQRLREAHTQRALAIRSGAEQWRIQSRGDYCRRLEKAIGFRDATGYWRGAEEWFQLFYPYGGLYENLA